MKSNLVFDKEYKTWLADIKTRIRNAQGKAALNVNTEVLTLYWSIGADIIIKQKNAIWGDNFLFLLSKDLMTEFPDMKGFSKRNLELIRQWYLFYSPIAKQPVSQLYPDKVAQGFFAQITRIPWGHNLVIIAKCKNTNEALYYVQNTIKHNWSRSVLVFQIKSGLFKRKGGAVHNFSLTLSKPQSDLATQTLKDPYVFDFLSMRKSYDERDLETALVNDVTQFLLELGSGFAYLGRQVPLSVGGQEFFIDLLFYHAKLRCYIVIELKTVGFEPEHAGKLNFYLTAVDRQLRTEYDCPSIGILICKKKNKVVVEYALSDIYKPISVSEYKLTHSLPNKLKSSLPTIKKIEKELSKNID